VGAETNYALTIPKKRAARYNVCWFESNLEESKGLAVWSSLSGSESNHGEMEETQISVNTVCLPSHF
jgi:hypothetical protein